MIERKPCGSSPGGGLPLVPVAERHTLHRVSNRGASPGDRGPARFPRRPRGGVQRPVTFTPEFRVLVQFIGTQKGERRCFRGKKW
jgi:hypothetical protein